jgi:hypothetical protein
MAAGAVTMVIDRRMVQAAPISLITFIVMVSMQKVFRGTRLLTSEVK